MIRRCKSRAPDGTWRCKLVRGHDGNHFNVSFVFKVRVFWGENGWTWRGPTT